MDLETRVPERTSSPAGFATALTQWKEISFADLQKTLDSQGLEVIENQKENMVGRKKLAEQTRDFRKITDDEKLVAFKGLLKAYQTEIDALTKRGKVAENAFLNVYKRLADAPDPFPLLDAAVDQTARASEARILEATLQRERDEMGQLKNQLQEAQLVDKERKKLADKCEKLEAKMEDMINEKVTAKGQEINAVYDERIRNYEEREKDLTKQVLVSRDQLRELRSSNESTNAKLLGHNQRQDQDTLSRLAEMDLLTADLARANTRVADMERRNEKLRAEIESVRTGSASSAKIAELEDQITDLQSETSRLLRASDDQAAAAAQERTALAKRQAEQQATVVRQKQELAISHEKLRNYSDYDEIKRELDIMKYIEFSGANMDEDDEDMVDESMSIAESSIRMPDPNGDKSRGRGKPLENLLLAKNRRVQEQLTNLRNAYEELATANEDAVQRTQTIEAQLQEQQSLNARLESDLARMNGNVSAGDPSARSKSPKPGDALSTLNLGKKAPETSVAPPGLTAAAESSILPIITSQRDRFRSRNAELEEEIRKAQTQLNDLRNETKALQGDNVKLYEKIRYLQSYRDENGAQAASAPKSLYASSAQNKTKDDTQLGKYRSLYEQSMNPFEAFKGRERTSAVAALNPIEGTLLGFANVILSNRTRRGLFIVYVVVAHIFILSTFFAWSNKSDATLPS